MTENLFNITFDEFRLMGFVDCKQERTSVPGSGPINEDNDRREGADGLQRAYFSSYGKKHGMKTQVVLLPNGMVGHAFVTPIAQNDKGVMNISGLEEHLAQILQPLDGTFLLPALYADDIYDPSGVLVKRGRPEDDEKAYFLKCNAGREKIEHEFGAWWNLWKLPRHTESFKILQLGKALPKKYLTLYFLMNCHTCLNGNNTSSTFQCDAPSLDEYLGGQLQPYDEN